VRFFYGVKKKQAGKCRQMFTARKKKKKKKQLKTCMADFFSRQLTERKYRLDAYMHHRYPATQVTLRSLSYSLLCHTEGLFESAKSHPRMLDVACTRS
jgi:hypothetical protein